MITIELGLLIVTAIITLFNIGLLGLVFKLYTELTKTHIFTMQKRKDGI